MKKIIINFFASLLSVFVAPILLLLVFIARYKKKKVDVGLGPHPLINNVYHKKSLELFGFTAETYVTHTYFITSEFDKKFSIKQSLPVIRSVVRILYPMYVFIWSIYRYRILYIYFNGAGLGLLPGWLWKVEPLLLNLAKVKTLVMPYGSDIQEMTRTPNLLFKHAMSKDYPGYAKTRCKVEQQVDIWTKWGSHLISGVEWVDYMYHWDTLMLGHFSIDTDTIKYVGPVDNKVFRVFHAPNHKEIKGTKYLISAIEELKSEGMNIELDMVEKVPNSEILSRIQQADVIADQFIIGWYAMFALEAMASGKPVLCYLRPDLVGLYENVGLVEKDEIPLVSCNCNEIKNSIKKLYDNRPLLEKLGRQSRNFVIKHHSLKSIGETFLKINTMLGVTNRNNITREK